MELLTHEVTLGFSNETGILNIPISQHDINRIISIGFTDYGEDYEIPEGTLVFLKAKKPDGTEINTDEFCTIVDNRVHLQVFEQLSVVNGTVQCEILLGDEDGIRYTSNHFNLIVNKSVHNDEHLRSSDTYKDLIDILLELKDIREYLDTNEAVRIENENQRIRNESQRVANEDQRITAEDERIENENERKQTFSNVLDTAKNYADSAKESSENAKISEENAENSALMSESWAQGNTGIREDEETNSSKYWCNQSQAFKEESENLLAQALQLLDEANRKVTDIDFEMSDDGELFSLSKTYDFEINDDGELEWSVIE